MELGEAAAVDRDNLPADAGPWPPTVRRTTSTLAILDDFVLRGEGLVSIGEIGLIACAAVASESHATFAALQHREGETLVQLLYHLEEAPSRTLDHDEYTD